jgi:hypothetical protein
MLLDCEMDNPDSLLVRNAGNSMYGIMIVNVSPKGTYNKKARMTTECLACQRVGTSTVAVRKAADESSTLPPTHGVSLQPVAALVG